MSQEQRSKGGYCPGAWTIVTLILVTSCSMSGTGTGALHSLQPAVLPGGDGLGVGTRALTPSELSHVQKLSKTVRHEELRGHDPGRDDWVFCGEDSRGRIHCLEYQLTVKASGTSDPDEIVSRASIELPMPEEVQKGHDFRTVAADEKNSHERICDFSSTPLRCWRYALPPSRGLSDCGRLAQVHPLGVSQWVLFSELAGGTEAIRPYCSSAVQVEKDGYRFHFYRENEEQVRVERCTKSGSWDRSFGSDGVLLVQAPKQGLEGLLSVDSALMTSAGILMGGSCRDHLEPKPCLFRLTAEFQPDPGFQVRAYSGWNSFRPATGATLLSLAQQADGSLSAEVRVSWSANLEEYESKLLHLSSDGSWLDPDQTKSERRTCRAVSAD